MIKIETITADYSLLFKSDDGFPRCIFNTTYTDGSTLKTMIFTNPSSTCNCQINTVGDIESFLNKDFDKDEIPIVREAFVNFAKRLNKACLMVDVKYNVLKRLKQLFTEEDFILEAPYTSTNGSELTICIINFLDYYED